MRSPLLLGLFLLVGLASTVLLTPAVHKIREPYLQERISQFGQIPSSTLSALTGEFKGVLADYFFLKLTTFTGYKSLQNEKLNHDEHEIIFLGIEKITDLDPHFWDPYVFATGIFAWEAGLIEKLEPLLLKAAKYRVNDYHPYYFLGFNRMYFLKDTIKAAEYLRIAASKPGCPDYLKTLAARLSLYGNQTIIGVAILEELLQGNNSIETRSYLTKRLDALKSILSLEKAVLAFYKKFETKPTSINDLFTSGIISEIPKDPYGGDWIIMENGRVYSTSQLVQQEIESNE